MFLESEDWANIIWQVNDTLCMFCISKHRNTKHIYIYIYIYIKNAACSIEQVLEATANKAVAVQPPTTHHENYQS